MSKAFLPFCMVNRAVDEKFSHKQPSKFLRRKAAKVRWVCVWSAPPQTQFLNCLSTNHSKCESQTDISYFWATSTINKKTDSADVTALRQCSSSHSQWFWIHPTHNLHQHHTRVFMIPLCLGPCVWGEKRFCACCSACLAWGRMVQNNHILLKEALWINK